MKNEPITWQTESGDTVEVFQAGESRGDITTQPGKWYWHLTAANGRIIATGGESFTRKWSAKRAALRSFPKAENDD